jgi:hypothetical protein|nr:MAG TPA: hypothetical protein [Caudoviricetes sp.]
MKQDLEKQREATAKHFAERLTKYLWTTVNGTSPVVKVKPCELGTNYSVFLEMNELRALASADLDSIDSMDNEIAWETETKRVGDHLLEQVERQITSRNKSERNGILLSGEVSKIRRAILGDIIYITRETIDVIRNKEMLSNKRRVFSASDTGIKDILGIIGSVVEKRLNQIEKREKTKE